VKVAQRRCGSGFSRDHSSQAAATSQVTAASPGGQDDDQGRAWRPHHKPESGDFSRQGAKLAKGD